MEKNDLLNLLIAGGIAFAIALSGAGLGVALNKGKSSTEEKSSDDVKAGFLGLYGNYKLLANKELKAAKQLILGIEVDDSKSAKQSVTVDTVADGKEVQALDLSKTIGNIDWIKKQLKHPNLYTSAVDKKALFQTGFQQTITFTVEFDGVKFDTKKIGIFGVEVSIVHTAFVAATTLVAKVPESWDFSYQMVTMAGTATATAGVLARGLPEKTNSDALKTALANSDAIRTKGIDVLLWKSNGVAALSGDDFEVAIILNKKTGKVFYFTTVADKFKGIAITTIPKIAYNL